MREWIDRAKGGDPEALGRCLEVCRNYLLRVAGRRLPASLAARMGASDIVQEVYLVCCTPEKFADFAGESEAELLAWARQVLVNVLIDEHRRQTAARRDIRREVALGDADPRESPQAGPVSSSTTPSGAAVRRERRELFLRAVEDLPRPDDREIMCCRYLLDLTFQEIAGLLELSKSYVVQRHAACIARIGPRFARAEGISDVRPAGTLNGRWGTATDAIHSKNGTTARSQSIRRPSDK